MIRRSCCAPLTGSGTGSCLAAGSVSASRLSEPCRASWPKSLGTSSRLGDWHFVVENIYWDSSLQHEVGLYYRLAWPAELADSDLDSGTEPGHSFRWAAISELDSVGFEPAG